MPKSGECKNSKFEGGEGAHKVSISNALLLIFWLNNCPNPLPLSSKASVSQGGAGGELFLEIFSRGKISKILGGEGGT